MVKCKVDQITCPSRSVLLMLCAWRASSSVSVRWSAHTSTSVSITQGTHLGTRQAKAHRICLCVLACMAHHFLPHALRGPIHQLLVGKSKAQLSMFHVWTHKSVVLPYMCVCACHNEKSDHYHGMLIRVERAIQFWHGEAKRGAEADLVPLSLPCVQVYFRLQVKCTRIEFCDLCCVSRGSCVAHWVTHALHTEQNERKPELRH